ncbi:MAG TPA: hypothetical protein DD433_00420 [Ruminococcaceae bacterium]|nr:hypothetical protein [Oscillospiraceae bacterium]
MGRKARKTGFFRALRKELPGRARSGSGGFPRAGPAFRWERGKKNALLGTGIKTGPKRTFSSERHQEMSVKIRRFKG